MSDLPHNDVQALVATPEGLWVGTEGGLARLHQGQWELYTTANSALPYNWVLALAATADRLWVGTWSGGLARLHQGQWELYTTANSALPHNWVWALATTPEGLWVGTSDGLARFLGREVPPQMTQLVGQFAKDTVTQLQHTFAAVAFDPTYQTALHMFRYHWVLERQKNIFR